MKKILFLGSLFIFLIAVGSAMATPYTGADITQWGDEYSSISGTGGSTDKTWFLLNAEHAIYTAWANNWVEYQADLTAGNWNIGLNVINRGNLGVGWYAEFRISNNLTTETISIPASDTEVNYGYINYNVSSDALYTVRYTWLNDQYNPPLDANIQINSVFFDDTATAPVPEPATMLLLASGLIGLVGFRRKFKR